MRYQALICAVLLVALLIYGCGGSGDAASNNASTSAGRGTLNISIQWPKHSKALTRLIPDGTNSITVALSSGNQVVKSKTLARPSGQSTISFSFTQLDAGDYTASSAAFTNTDGTGSVLANGATSLHINANGDSQASITMDAVSTGGGSGSGSGSGGSGSSVGGSGSSSTVFVSESDAAASQDDVGFARQGTPSYWHDETDVGDGGHMLWTWNNDTHGVDNIGQWRASLPESRSYEVFTFIPRKHAYTDHADYEIYHADGRTDVIVDQYNYNDEWVSLGTYRFDQGTSAHVRLSDNTGEPYASHKIGFDTLKWEPR